MNFKGSLSVLMGLMLTSASVMGSEPAGRLQVPWSMLGEMIRGKRVTLQLAEGETVKGRVRKVTATSLVFKVKKSSDRVAYPKGEVQIPKESVARIEMRRRSSNKRALLGIGTFFGTLFGSVLVVVSSADLGGSFPGELVWILVGISGAVATTVYHELGRARVTIEILPDSPGEQEEKDNAPAATGSGPVAGALRTGA